MLRRTIFLLLCIVAIAAGVLAFLYYYERYEEDVDDGYAATAQRNPYLAAEQFIRARDARVESAFRLNSLDRIAEFDTVFIPYSAYLISESQQQQMFDWIDQGGHLIIGVDDSDDKRNFLFHYFDVKRVDIDVEADDAAELPFFSPADCVSSKNSESSEGDKEQNGKEKNGKKKEESNENCKPKSVSEGLRELNERIKSGEFTFDENGLLKNKNGESESPPEQLTTSYFDGMEQPLVLSFLPEYTLYHPYMDAEEDESDDFAFTPTYMASDGNDNVHLMQFAVGEGLVTVFSDSELWRNASIDQFNHALLLDTLIGQQTLILFGRQALSLPQLIWQNAKALVVTLCLLALAWLWRSSVRIGPLQNLPPLEHRALADYLLAEGRYLWRHKERAALLSGLRESVLQRAAITIPQWQTLDGDQKVAILAARVNAVYNSDSTDGVKRYDSSYNDVLEEDSSQKHKPDDKGFHNSVDSDELKKALFDDRVQSERQLQQFVAIIQRLGKQL